MLAHDDCTIASRSFHIVLSGLLKTLEIPAVPHGFRSTFRDWAAEETNHPREVVEAALAHVVQNKVEAAYARSDLFERRRRLMNDWAAYLAGASGQVVALHRAEYHARGTRACARGREAGAAGAGGAAVRRPVW